MIANQASGSSNSLPSASESRVSYFSNETDQISAFAQMDPWGKMKLYGCIRI